MSKKLQNNGLWESSRMMLPEHKEEILRQNQDQKKKARLELDEQQLMEISAIIQESLQNGSKVSVIIFDEFEDIQLTGIVTRVDQYSRTIKLQGDDDYDLIKMDDIILGCFNQ